MKPAIRNNPAIYPPDELLGRLEWMRDVGKAVRVYDRAWTELNALNHREWTLFKKPMKISILVARTGKRPLLSQDIHS